MSNANPSAERTRRSVYLQLLGANWLGRASLEEYAVGSWLENEGIGYIFHPMIGEIAGRREKSKLRVPLEGDFLVTSVGGRILIEVEGDMWHSGLANVARNRDRANQLRYAGYQVVQVFGHDILAYPGFPIPTEASFDRIMRSAINGIQISQEGGGRYF